MTKRFYFDTSIWLDYYLKRGKNGEAAFKLIQKIVEDDYILVFSDYVIKELKRYGFTKNEIKNIIRLPKYTKLNKIHVNKFHILEARKLAFQRKIPFGDAIHAVLGKAEEAILISKDHHFEKLKDIIIVKKPEDFIELF